MPKYLGQVVGQLPDVQRQIERRLHELSQSLRTPALFKGETRDYTPYLDPDSGGEALPGKYVAVQLTATEVIAEVKQILRELFDITAARDFTNGPGSAGGAVADVAVDGNVLVEACPVPYLLWLDGQLDRLRSLAGELPVLDAAARPWTLIEDRGIYQSREERTTRAVQVEEPLVLYPATDKHPAQVKTTTTARNLGTWTVTQLSGAVEPDVKAGILQRIAKLKAAVQAAKVEANRVPAAEVAPGGRVLDFVFG